MLPQSQCIIPHVLIKYLWQAYPIVFANVNEQDAQNLFACVKDEDMILREQRSEGSILFNQSFPIVHFQVRIVKKLDSLSNRDPLMIPYIVSNILLKKCIKRIPGKCIQWPNEMNVEHFILIKWV